MPSGNFFQFDANSLLDGLGDQLIRFWGSKVTADAYFVNSLSDFFRNFHKYCISPSFWCQGKITVIQFLFRLKQFLKKKTISMWKGQCCWTLSMLTVKAKFIVTFIMQVFWLFIMLWCCCMCHYLCAETILDKKKKKKKEIMLLSTEALAMNHETKKALLNRWDGPSIHLLSYSCEEWI